MYTFALRRPGRPDVMIPFGHENLFLSSNGVVMMVRATWCRSRVDRPASTAARVLRDAWPQVDSLVMFHGADLAEEPVEVFAGVIESVDFSLGEFTVIAEQEVLTPLGVTVSPGPSGPLSVSVVVNGDDRPALVDFGDGQDPEVNPGNGLVATSREYAAGGTYTITVTDAEDSSRSVTEEVVLPWP